MTAAATLPPGRRAATEGDRLAELERLERDIERGLQSIGGSLAAIHRDRLYRAAGFRSFEVYLAERWSISRPRGYELIRAWKVAEAITADGGEPPASEATLRPLTPILSRSGPKAAARAWRTVVAEHDGDGPPTSRDVRTTLEKKGKAVDRRPLDEAGKLLTSLVRYVERYGDSPLEEALRPLAGRYGERARAVGAAFDVLARGELVPPGSLTAAPWCLGHGRVRDEKGVCRLCGERDVRA